MDRISILGLGTLGASLGLALTRAELPGTEVVGFDPSSSLRSRASKSGAVHTSFGDLQSALYKTDLVILNMPFAQMEETFRFVGMNLKRGTTITDTSPSKITAIRWARTYLAETTSFIPGRPLPSKTMSVAEGADGAVFDGTRYCVIASESVDQISLKNVLGLIEIIGAEPLFLSAQEHDSFTAAVSYIPRLLATALVNKTNSSMSWREMSRFAGAEFDLVSQLSTLNPNPFSGIYQTDANILINWLGQMIEELSSYQESLQDQTCDISKAFLEAKQHITKFQTGEIHDDNAYGDPSTITIASAVIGENLLNKFRRVVDLKKKLPKNPTGQ